MDLLALKLLLAPLLVVVASLCARRFGPTTGGLVAGLPIIAGPILLVLTLAHGHRYGAEASRAAVLGLLSLTVFVVIYALLSESYSWRIVLPVGWAAFLAATAGLNQVSLSVGVSLALSAAGFGLALAVIPRPAAASGRMPAAGWDLPMRAASAAILVLVLSALSKALGAQLAGLLAPFPIVTSVLAVFTHEQLGSDATRRLLRGMVQGFFAFALFCAIAAVALPEISTSAAFGLASAGALAVQAGLLSFRARAAIVSCKTA